MPDDIRAVYLGHFLYTLYTIHSLSGDAVQIYASRRDPTMLQVKMAGIYRALEITFHIDNFIH